jgi:hypothetical protein
MYPKKYAFFRLAKVRHPHVRQHLLLQDLARVLYTLLFGDTGSGASGADKIQSDVLLLDDESFVERRFHHLHHLGVLEVVNDVFEDVAVGDETQRSEDDHDGDFLLDVR